MNRLLWRYVTVSAAYSLRFKGRISCYMGVHVPSVAKLANSIGGGKTLAEAVRRITPRLKMSVDWLAKYVKNWC